MTIYQTWGEVPKGALVIGPLYSAVKAYDGSPVINSRSNPFNIGWVASDISDSTYGPFDDLGDI